MQVEREIERRQKQQILGTVVESGETFENTVEHECMVVTVANVAVELEEELVGELECKWILNGQLIDAVEKQ